MSERKDYIKAMLIQQYRLNKSIHTQWWLQGFSWHLAIDNELTEALDCLPWQWWRPGEVKEGLLRYEMMDVLHFGFSLLLEKEMVKGTSVYTSAERVAVRVSDIFDVADSHESYIELIEGLKRSAISAREFDVERFVRFVRKLDLSFEEMYSLFVKKNALNCFRQDHGDGKGEYSKFWIIDGVRRKDDEWLQDVTANEDRPDLNYFDNIYLGLKSLFERRES